MRNPLTEPDSTEIPKDFTTRQIFFVQFCFNTFDYFNKSNVFVFFLVLDVLREENLQNKGSALDALSLILVDL